MHVDVVMPKLGLTMESGTIARWIKRPGEAVREGEALLEVSTDKINYEVEAPASGTVLRAIGGDGEEFACGEVIGVIALAAGSGSGHPEAVEGRISSAPDATTPPRVIEAPRISSAANGVAPTRPLRQAQDDPTIAISRSNGERIVASPAARRLARERGIALNVLRGSGPGGRITIADVPDRGAALRRAQGENAATPPNLPPQRRAIYRKMTRVGVLPIPQVESVVRVDAIADLIARRGDFGWTAFAAYAVSRLLREHPQIRTNAETGAPFESCDIGLAADTPHGLIVPVVRNADHLSLAEIQREIVRLAALAREGTIGAGEIGGACFSISNVGPQGVERVAPLPDPPQTAILGIGAATLRPAVVEGAVRPARMLTCVVSFDHRFIDGAPAARFLAALARAFEDPGTLL